MLKTLRTLALLAGLLVPSAAAAQDTVHPAGPDVTDAGARPSGPIRASLTRTLCAVGCDFEGLEDARDWVYGQQIVGNSFITLQLRDGVYRVATQVFMVSDIWKHVTIVGNCQSPGRVVIEAATAAQGLPLFGAAQGGGLNSLDCLVIKGVGAFVAPGVWKAGSFGAAIAARGSGAYINVGGKVTVNDYYYGAMADELGRINGAAGFTVNNSGDCNFLARFGGVIDCPFCIANRASHTATVGVPGTLNLGFNFLAEAGGVGIWDGSKGTGAHNAGVMASLGGTAWCHGCEMSGSAGRGASAILNGSLAADGARLHHNETGAGADTGGYINIDGTEAYRNRGDGFLADGGRIQGAAPRSHDNGTGPHGGVGFRSIDMGSLRAFGAIAAGSQGNASGLSYVSTGAACASAAATDCQPASALTVN